MQRGSIATALTGLVIPALALSCSIAPSLRYVASNTKAACATSAAERQALNGLSYQAFDQSLPEGGWRKYQACPRLTQELIDAYTAQNSARLQMSQLETLDWHSGQLSAMAGNYADAIAKMKRTFKSEERPNDNFNWNPYVAATIAFLEKDRGTLVKARELIARGTNPYNHMNVRIVDTMIRCFDHSYEAAYSGRCDPPETNVQRIRSLAIGMDLTKPFSTSAPGLVDFLQSSKVIQLDDPNAVDRSADLYLRLVEAVAVVNTKTLVLIETPSRKANRVLRNVLRRLPNLTIESTSEPTASQISERLKTFEHIVVVTNNGRALDARAWPQDLNPT